MAVTSLWPVSDNLKRLINYARNPEKTTEEYIKKAADLHTVQEVIHYAANDLKTERRAFVTGLNCDEENAAKQFMQTKQFWGKTDGRVCYHGYQSFNAEEVDALTAHEIGVKLAEKLWGDRFEVLIATHLNTGHYHNHFVINSVSFSDGYKFYNNHEDYHAMRDASDELCREYGLSVLPNEYGRGKHYAEWLAENEGRPTIRGTIRADIDWALEQSLSEGDFMRAMQNMGYEIKTRTENGNPLKHPAVKPYKASGWFRLDTLGKAYTLDNLRFRIEKNALNILPFPEVETRRKKVPFYAGNRKGLVLLFHRYTYELHSFARHPASIRRVSFLMRKDVAVLDRLDKQTLFLAKNNIETLEQLQEYRAELMPKQNALISLRNDLRNQVKRQARVEDWDGVEESKAHIRQISSELKTGRTELKLCDDIQIRSLGIACRVNEIEMEEKYEQLQRSRRPSREDEFERC